MIAVEHFARYEGDSTEFHRHIALTRSGLGALAWIGAQCLHADLQGAQDRRIPHRAVDDDAGPAVVDAAPGDDVTHERGVDTRATVDDEDPPLAGFAEGLFHQQVVLEAANGDDPATEHRMAAELRELRITAADLGADLVREVGGCHVMC